MSTSIVLCILLLFSGLTANSEKEKLPGKSGNYAGYLERKPYVQHVTPTQLSILWETPIPEECEITLTSKVTDYVKTLKSPKNKHHEVRFTGLAPKTEYDYSVKSIQGTYSGTVKTQVTGDEPFTFLVYGDNRYGHRVHQTIVNMMALEKASFYINTGDLVDDGLVRKNWWRFFRIENILMKNIPLYPAVGNHENCFGVGERLWRRYFALPLNGPQKEKAYFMDWGNSRFIFLNTNESLLGSTQIKWFRDTLKETALNKTVRHIFVIVHQSPYTSGPHGPNTDLIDSGAVSDMRKFGVTMIFAGHDHIYERGRVDGLNYVISGGGGAPIYYIRTHSKNSLIAEPVYHYIRVMVHGSTIEYKAMRSDGTLLDFFVTRKISDSKGRVSFKIIKEFNKDANESEPESDSSVMKPSLEEEKEVEQIEKSEKKESLNILLVLIMILLGLGGAFAVVLKIRSR
ncbi:MAG: metallophosphoesterase [Deltaproteobacteria bacterium]|nr:metallophosphoesterase [Deltaproteobacteria bacterium]